MNDNYELVGEIAWAADVVDSVRTVKFCGISPPIGAKLYRRKSMSKEEFLDLAMKHGAKLTGKPDGSEPIQIVFDIESWRSYTDVFIKE